MNWHNLRAQFPVTEKWAFFDHAAVAPPSRPARDALIEWANDLADNGAVSDGRWQRRLSEVRNLAGKLINANPTDIAFIKNTSEGIGIVADGYRWKKGDNVVTAEEEYPANIYPWLNLATWGVETRRVPSRGGQLHFDDIRAAMDERTRIVSLSFVEFASGFRNDLDALGSLCRERGVLFLVDAIQGLGVLPLDVQKTPIDFLAADGHKWLLAPEAAGIFYARREVLDQHHPVGIGWNSVIGARDFSKIDFRLKPHAGRYESGTLNFGGISALGASMQLLLEIGIENIRDRVLELTDVICDMAERKGWQVSSSRREGDKSGIVSLSIPGDVRLFVKQCLERGVVVNQRAGRLRVSPHFYNTVEEIERIFSRE